MPANPDLTLLQQIASAPIPYDLRARDIAFERWRSSIAKLGPALRQKAEYVESIECGRNLLGSVFGNSPFLTRCVLNDPSFAVSAFHSPPKLLLQAINVGMGPTGRQDTTALMKVLRRARAQVAILVALVDLGGIFTLQDVTKALSDFADAVLAIALRHLLAEASERGQFVPENELTPELASGIVLIAMGKYGAYELNYSSDIDLVAFYDPNKLSISQIEAGKFVARLAKDLVNILQSRTEDNFVFRVDFRLRPDGNSGPLAISIAAAEHYYESAGQNWERAAYIKARPCAGDLVSGEALLHSLRPYIWRKNLDYAAIDDIHSIKRQIHAAKGHGEIAVAGHNLKLGRGGIREIELFAQTQQLILGGRLPDLRVRSTCEALRALRTRNLISPLTCDELVGSYEFLRKLEHRLQMIEDEQTHSVPTDGLGVEHLARFSGYSDNSQFETELRQHLERVQRHYARLFERADPLSAKQGNLVFTGVEDDADTLSTIAQMGFRAARDVSGRIRAWHHGRIRATRSPRARESLTELIPNLLASLSRAPDPDSAFAEFARFAESLPAGVQIFSTLGSKPQLLDLLVEIFSLAPRLARVLTERPELLDSLIDPEFLSPTGDEPAPDGELAENLSHTKTLEAGLDQVRVFARELQFRTALRTLKGDLEPVRAARAFSMAADCSIRALLALAQVEISRRHGRIAAGEFVVVGLGKLGGEEMTASSDLDLLFVYDFDPDHAFSDGPTPLHATQYFTRLGQRLISLLTVATVQGRLYEVDMRLRPSGRAGPVAVTLGRLKSYHEGDAWVYEQMALTRARIVAGSPLFAPRVQSAIRDLIMIERNIEALSRDAADIRRRLREAKVSEDPWNLKFVRGGLVDLEYIAQVLLLAFANRQSEIVCSPTIEIFKHLAVYRLVSELDLCEMIAITESFQGLTQLLRIVYEREYAPVDAPAELKSRLCTIAKVPNFAALEDWLRLKQARVSDLFDIYVENLAITLSKT